MTTDTPTIQLKPSDTDLLAGPLLFGLIVGIPAAAGIGCLFWKPDELIDHWEVFLIFGVVFVLVFAVVRYLNTTYAFWKIENGAVYRGKKLLFHLNEIQEAHEGLPDNWITALDRLPINFRGKGAFALQAVARKKVIILKLTEGRWFMWEGLLYDKSEQFREALMKASPTQTISQCPDSIIPRLQLRNANRIMHE